MIYVMTAIQIYKIFVRTYLLFFSQYVQVQQMQLACYSLFFLCSVDILEVLCPQLDTTTYSTYLQRSIPTNMQEKSKAKAQPLTHWFKFSKNPCLTDIIEGKGNDYYMLVSIYIFKWIVDSVDNKTVDILLNILLMLMPSISIFSINANFFKIKFYSIA